MDDRGSVILTLAVLLFGSVLMLGLAVDLARVGAAWRETAHLATAAAEAGAGWIDVSEARGDRLVVDRARAGEAAHTVAAGRGRAVEVHAGLDRVCVTVSATIRPSMLTMIGAVPAAITASACAEPRKG